MKNEKKNNKAVVPRRLLVTDHAYACSAPSNRLAHLKRWASQTMKKSTLLVVILTLQFPAVIFSGDAHAEAQVPKHAVRPVPKVSIHRALTIADERYSKMPKSSKTRFVESARFLEHNESKPEMGPRWIITYAPLHYGRGGQIFVTVYMDETTSVFHGR